MKNRSLGLLPLFVLLAPIALARVLSYAPYTDRAAIPAYQLRNTRHFVLMEGPAEQVDNIAHGDAEVVMYDSNGTVEPRVIFTTKGNDYESITFAALYEPEVSAAIPPPLPPPMLLVGSFVVDANHAFSPVTLLSTDGGTSWKRIGELDGKYANPLASGDSGGPWVRGMAAPVRIGNAAYPFVVQYSQFAIAIHASGTIRQLVTTPGSLSNHVIGQDRFGNRFIVRDDSSGTFAIVDLRDGTTSIAGAMDAYATDGAWITDDGGVYLTVFGQYLDYYRNRERLLRHTVSFAVPTHDFSGAWILNRGAGAPTTLSRHSPASGITTHWTDVSGPEVEALIAGESGQTVLVQVHRERPQSEQTFIDPALAVWRVGDPAPRSYDELFMNEGWSKTFVHVDVDRIAAGEPFVFDSGYVPSWFPDLPISPPPPVSGGGDVAQEWGVIRASLKQKLVLPGVARLHGAFDSYWLTDVIVYNPLDALQDVDVRFVAIGEEEVQSRIARQATLTLGPREIRLIPDVLQTLFKMEEGGGTLHFDPAAGMNVTARTYSRNSNGGTFGFGMLGIDAFNAAGPRFSLTFSGAFPGQNFRTNMLLTDTSGRGTAAKLQAYGVSGTMGSSDFGFAAVPSGTIQWNGITGPLGLVANDSGGLVVRPTRGTAIATVVAIDNRTNDPTYFPPDLSGSNVRTIPVVGHVDGANNSRFRSDLYLLNLSDHARTVSLEAKPWEATAAPIMVQFTLLPSEARVITDVLPKLFHIEGLARLRYWSQGTANETEGIRVTSRTYSINEDGGTYGCLIPPLNHFQSASSGEALEILGIVGGSGFRTNLGLLELSQRHVASRTTDVRITIVDHAGATLDSFVVTVPSAAGMQINDIFAARGITAPPAGLIRVEVLGGGGLVGAYATLTDNITNDSTFLGAQLAAR